MPERKSDCLLGDVFGSNRELLMPSFQPPYDICAVRVQVVRLPRIQVDGFVGAALRGRPLSYTEIQDFKEGAATEGRPLQNFPNQVLQSGQP